jgi:hypothetical protein
MKISVLSENSVSVTTEVGSFEVGPLCLDPRTHPEGRTSASWAIVAVSRDPLTPHRFLSRRYPTAEAAQRAFRDGFEVMDPKREPRLTASKIVTNLLRSPGVVAA